jgi:hypothetical protein
MKEVKTLHTPAVHGIRPSSRARTPDDQRAAEGNDLRYELRSIGYPKNQCLTDRV